MVLNLRGKKKEEGIGRSHLILIEKKFLGGLLIIIEEYSKKLLGKEKPMQMYKSVI